MRFNILVNNVINQLNLILDCTINIKLFIFFRVQLVIIYIQFKYYGIV
jgi:hypothetical protein